METSYIRTMSNFPILVKTLLIFPIPWAPASGPFPKRGVRALPDKGTCREIDNVYQAMCNNALISEVTDNTVFNLRSAHALKTEHWDHFELWTLNQLRISNLSSGAVFHCVDEKQCRSWSAGFIRSQLIRSYTVFKRDYRLEKKLCALLAYYLGLTQ